jgi:hypothetical protein
MQKNVDFAACRRTGLTLVACGNIKNQATTDAGIDVDAPIDADIIADANLDADADAGTEGKNWEIVEPNGEIWEPRAVLRLWCTPAESGSWCGMVARDGRRHVTDDVWASSDGIPGS